jgi:predicted transcriptional regulator
MEKAKIIEMLIREKGYNLKSFSEKCGIPYTTLYGIVKNGVGRASVDNIIAICKHLGITVEELENMTTGESIDMRPPTFEDLERVISKHGKGLTAEEKMQLIKMLSGL